MEIKKKFHTDPHQIDISPMKENSGSGFQLMYHQKQEKGEVGVGT